MESEFAVGGFEVSGFAEGGRAVEEPCGGPVEHVGELGGWGAEAGVAAAGVIEPCGGVFRAGEVDRAAETLGEGGGEFADWERVLAGDVDGDGWGGSGVQALDGVGAGVALPDDIDPA